MECEACGETLQEGNDVVREQFGVIVNGVFTPADVATIRHDECSEEE